MAAAKSRLLPRGWEPTGSHYQCYDMGVTSATCHSGTKCGYIKSIEAQIDGFGSLAQDMAADDFVGHGIKLSAWVKSKNVDGWAGIWMRVDAGSSFVSFDNMQDRPIKGDTDWTRYELTLNVPEYSTRINFGVLLVGTGQVWMDDFVLEKVAAIPGYHSCDLYRSCGVRYQEEQAVNLDFSQGLRYKTQDKCLKGVPVGWFKQDHGQYPCKIGVEKARSAGEPSAAFIQSEYSDGHGALLQSVATEGFAGKRVKLTAMIKTADVKGEAALFYRADVDRALSVTYDHMDGRKLSGSNDWEEHNCVIDVPKDSDNIYFGGTLTGAGTVWFTDFNLEVVSSEVKTTGDFGSIVDKPKRRSSKYVNAEPLNLDFSLNDCAVNSEGIPEGWVASGGAPQNFEMGLAPDMMPDGKPCAMLRAICSDGNNFGTLMQTAGADKLLGKRLRLSASIKTEDVAWAALWLRIDNASGKMLGFDNMRDRPIKGTTDWSRYECVLDVSNNAKQVAFGVLMTGRGTAWFGDVSLDVVGDDVEVTGLAYEGDGEKGVNLDFEGL